MTLRLSWTAQYLIGNFLAKTTLVLISGSFDGPEFCDTSSFILLSLYEGKNIASLYKGLVSTTTFTLILSAENICLKISK